MCFRYLFATFSIISLFLLNLVSPVDAEPLSLPTLKKMSSLQSAWTQSIAFEHQGNYTKAYEALNAVTPTRPWTCNWNIRKGWLLTQLKQYQSAYSAYKMALRAQPHSVEAQTGILTPLVNMNRWQEVYARAEDLTQNNPSIFLGHYHLCLAEQQLQKWSSLLDSAKQGLKYYPNSLDLLIFKARALNQKGDIDSAISSYASALIISPQNIEALNYLSIYDI